MKLSLSTSPLDRDIATWTFAFASSHIGMSAIRRDIIRNCGEAADNFQLVGNADWRLPDVWPGDEDGGQAIFPTADIAGRQLYRVLYTGVSFATLGGAFLAYLDSLQQQPPETSADPLAFWIAVLSWAASLTSLANPSPLSLVPAYDRTDGGGLLARDDGRKLTARGLTRVTRHPLILPVVPWALATARLAGGQSRDYALFGGLALYALAGCYAQDLRVAREEGSVGTVFRPDASLGDFLRDTSFVPFHAVLDGRQSVSDVVKEVPWWASGVGIAIGYQLQSFVLVWIVSQAP